MAGTPSHAYFPNEQVKPAAALTEDTALLAGTMHVRVDEVRVTLREPKSNRAASEAVRRQYLTCLTVSRIVLRHDMDQGAILATLPSKEDERTFTEDRHGWLTRLYGHHLENPLLRLNTTMVRVTNIVVHATAGGTEEVILERAGAASTALPPDTPAMQLEFTTFHRAGLPPGRTSKGAPPAMSRAPPNYQEPFRGRVGSVPEFMIPPPCFFCRVYPLRVNVKQDAVMQLIRFALACQIGSTVLGAEPSSSDFERLIREISDAPDVETLTRCSKEVPFIMLLSLCSWREEKRCVGGGGVHQ
jgi:hypothetical protein